MSHKPNIVIGEARESDSEEEIDSSVVGKNVAEPCKGKVVSGEAPESDEENITTSASLESVSSAVSALSAPTVGEKKKTSSKNHQSILARKLYERNASLHKNINEFVEQTTTNAGNELNATNKKLLKCQLQMQEGADYLRILNSTLTALDTNLQMLLSTQYLPVIRIDENAQENAPS